MQLAKAGYDVTVIERRSQVGGRTSAIELEGHRFDCGPTFFSTPRVLSEIFQSVGRDLFEEVPMKRLDPQYRLTFGAGGSLTALRIWTAWISRLAKYRHGTSEL